MTAADQIKVLVAKHNLSVMQDPGGGEFRHPSPVYGRCRVSFYDDQEDLDKLRTWLIKNGLENPEPE